MKALNWFVDFFTNRGKATALYKRGMAKARKHDHAGAIADYTTTIQMPGLPADLLAMVLFNRALVYVAVGDEQHGVNDLDAVLTISGPHSNIRAMARQKRARMKSRAAH